jgi:uncharacterized protein YjbJ (UPF0337 family)
VVVDLRLVAGGEATWDQARGGVSEVVGEFVG